MKKLLFIFLLLCSQIASASYAPTTPGYYFPTSNVAYKGSPAAACESLAGWRLHPTLPAQCINENNISTSPWGGPAMACQDLSKPVAGVCGDSTIPPPTCTPGREFSVTVSQGFKVAGTSKTTDMKAPSNVGGCRVYPGAIEECKSAPSGEVFCTWRVTEGGVAPTGESPASSATAPATATPDKVPEFNPAQGQGCPKGTVNLGTDSTGGSICGGSGTSPSTPTKTEVKQPTTTTTNADGSTTKVETTTRTNTDGSQTTTTKTTTTGTDGKVTTTENSSTGNQASGAKGVSDSKDEDKTDFCKQHPELNACKNSTVTGTCEAVACTGDAIACMIAKQSSEMNCREKKIKEEIDDSAQKTLGTQVAGGNDPLGATLPKKENAVTYNVTSNIETGGWLGGGSCFQDKSISYLGQTRVIPMSSVCDPLIILRFVAMIIASLISFRMLSGVILRD